MRIAYCMHIGHNTHSIAGNEINYDKLYYGTVKSHCFLVFVQ